MKHFTYKYSLFSIVKHSFSLISFEEFISFAMLKANGSIIAVVAIDECFINNKILHQKLYLLL